MKLEQVYVASYKGQNIDKISKLKMSEDEKQTFYHDIHSEFETKCTQEIEAFNSEVYFEPRPYFVEMNFEKGETSFEKKLKKFQSKIEVVISDPNREDILIDTTYRLFLLTINDETKNKKYIVISKIPSRKQITHKKFMIVSTSLDVEYIELEKGIPVFESITAIYCCEEKQFRIFNIAEFDSILFDHTALKEEAKEKLKELKSGDFSLYDYKINGVNDEYISKLGTRHFKVLTAYNPSIYSQKITKEQFKKAVQHSRISKENRIEIVDGTIKIKNQGQFNILISALSERLLLDLLNNKIKTAFTESEYSKES